MMRVMPLVITCLAVLSAMATASQDTRSHELGVVVRLYDIGVGVQFIPELAPEQLPNVAKVMDTIELRTDRDDFAPLKDNFVTEVIGELKIDKPGAYGFRLISDDGSRLWIDGRLVTDHDGLHGAEPKDGSVELDADVHSIRILHFESAGDEHLELRWKPAGSPETADFVLIPAAALTHSSDVSRETAPGTKKIIPPLRPGRPGDGTPVAGMNPSFAPLPADFWESDDHRLKTMEKVRQPLYLVTIVGEWPIAEWRVKPIGGDEMLRMSRLLYYRHIGMPVRQAQMSLLAWLPAVGGVPTVPQELGFAYQGSALVGDGTTGEMHRVFLDVVGDRPQGCMFRFSGPKEKGVQALASVLDAGFAVGTAGFDLESGADCLPEIYMLGGVDDPSKAQSVRPEAFEALAVGAMTNGFEIEFTKPLDPRCGWEADSYYIEQWPFRLAGTEARRHEGTEEGAAEATEEDTAQEAVAHRTEPGVSAAGQQTEPEAQARVSSPSQDTAREAVAHAEAHPPRRDGIRYPVKSATVSPDRKKVFLEIENLKPSHVVYIRLLPPCVSEDGELPWSTEAWYTLNEIPENRVGEVLTPPKPEPQNFLTEEEKAAGWELLFDGKTTDGWRGYRKDAFPDQGWKVIDGCLVRVGPGGGDIVTVEEFDNFELKLEWRICAGGNSGVFYRVDEQFGWPWESGPEMQVLDNAEHADGRNPKTSAGSNYALHAPVKDVTEPVGFFNKVRIVVDGSHIEHWLNGVKVVEYELGSDEWKELVAGSKFAQWPNYGRVKKGHIDLQDHGDKVWYRNIKIRRLKGD